MFLLSAIIATVVTAAWTLNGGPGRLMNAIERIEREIDEPPEWRPF